MTTRLGIIIAAALGFAVTLAITWPRHGLDWTTAAPVAPRVPSRLAAAGAPTLPAGASDSSVRPVARRHVPPPRPVAAPEPPGDDLQDNQDLRPQRTVPALFTAVERPGVGTPSAVLRNLSDQSLDVTVTVQNPRTGRASTMQVTVPPGRRPVDLTVAGLDFQPGDRVTVHSPPYQDQLLQ